MDASQGWDLFIHAVKLMLGIQSVTRNQLVLSLEKRHVMRVMTRVMKLNAFLLEQGHGLRWRNVTSAVIFSGSPQSIEILRDKLNPFLAEINAAEIAALSAARESFPNPSAKTVEEIPAVIAEEVPPAPAVEEAPTKRRGRKKAAAE
jgi:hypothetical protein